MSFNIEYFPNESDRYIYDVSVDILNKYGTSMDEDEFKDLKKYREKRAEEATEYLLTKDLFVKSGCTNYDDLIKGIDNYYDGEESKKELNDLHSKIVFEENNYLFWQLDNLDYVIDRYENKELIGLGGLEESPAQNQDMKRLEKANRLIHLLILEYYKITIV